MQKQDPASIACSVAPSSTHESKKPSSMGSQKGAAPPTKRSAAGHEIVLTDDSPAPEDFEFCVLSSDGLALAGGDAAAGMCAADEVFSGGKLLPLRLSSSLASGLLLLRSDSLDGAASTSGSSSLSTSSSSVSVSRSTSSSSSASSSDPAASVGSSSHKSSASSSVDAVAPLRRSTSSSVFYAHPSPSPCPPRRSSASRRSTGTAPPAAWGIIRLGVVGAPEVYPRRAPADSRKVVAAAAARAGGSQSARFEQASKEAKKLGLGLFGAGLVCSCSPDAVAPVGTAEAAASAEARRRRKKAEDKKRAAKQSTSRRSRILDWLEEHSSKPRTKNVE